jgi:hypothetical protein
MAIKDRSIERRYISEETAACEPAEDLNAHPQSHRIVSGGLSSLHDGHFMWVSILSSSSAPSLSSYMALITHYEAVLPDQRQPGSAAPQTEGQGTKVALPFGPHPETCPVRSYLVWQTGLRHRGPASCSAASTIGGSSPVSGSMSNSVARIGSSQRRDRCHSEGPGRPRRARSARPSALCRFFRDTYGPDNPHTIAQQEALKN